MKGKTQNERHQQNERQDTLSCCGYAQVTHFEVGAATAVQSFHAVAVNPKGLRRHGHACRQRFSATEL